MDRDMTPEDYALLSTTAYPALYQISLLMDRGVEYSSPFFLVPQELFSDAFVEMVRFCAKTGSKMTMYDGEVDKNNFLFKGLFVTFIEE
jgi:hypothetical protein